MVVLYCVQLVKLNHVSPHSIPCIASSYKLAKMEFAQDGEAASEEVVMLSEEHHG